MIRSGKRKDEGYFLVGEKKFFFKLGDKKDKMKKLKRACRYLEERGKL